MVAKCHTLKVSMSFTSHFQLRWYTVPSTLSLVLATAKCKISPARVLPSRKFWARLVSKSKLLKECLNKVAVIHKHIYCLHLKWITCGEVWAVQVTAPPIQTFSNSEQKKQAASTTINLTNSFKLQYTLLHAGTCGRSEWHRVTSCRMTISRRYICTLNEMNRIRSPFYTVVPSGSRSK